MLDVKNNFRGKHNDNICRGCGTTEETQEHVLSECTGIHNNQEIKVQLQEIFDENTEQLKGKAEKNRSYNDKAYQEWGPRVE